MAGYNLTADDVACIKKLAELYEKGETWVVMGVGQDGQALDPLGLPAERRMAILGVMDDMGLLVRIEHVGSSRYWSFHIDPKVLQAARAIPEAELKMQLAEEERRWRAEQERKDREYRDKRDKEDAEWRQRQERENRRLSNRQLWIAGVLSALAVAAILAITQFLCTWWQISDARASRAAPTAQPPSSAKP